MPGFEVVGEEELNQIQSIFDAGGVLFRHGFDGLRGGVYKVRDFENAFAAEMQVDRALAVASGTAALRVALAALGIGSGDSVVLPAFTFVATAEAVIESGATPICCEVDETLNLCPDDLSRRIRPDTRAVIVVHMLGGPARLDRILEVCSQHGVELVEDTAWGCGGFFADRPLGTWGRIGTYSFDFAKTMTTGEGGMLVFQRESDYLAAAAWHDHGHENNPTVPRWEDTRRSSGFNFRMSELQAAVGLAQLAKLRGIIAGQTRNHDRIGAVIADIDGIVPRPCPTAGVGTCDAFVFSAVDAAAARRCRDGLLARGTGTKILPEAISWHFAGTWSHMPQLVSSHDGDLARSFPRTSDLLARSVALPTTVRADDADYDAIREAIRTAVRG
jgi:8-amino-3,8-dideoxy-alpha-D-manno-octulosonate transaminase